MSKVIYKSETFPDRCYYEVRDNLSVWYDKDEIVGRLTDVNLGHIKQGEWCGFKWFPVAPPNLENK